MFIKTVFSQEKLEQAKKFSSLGVWVETMTLMFSRSLPQGIIYNNLFDKIGICSVEGDVNDEEMGLGASHSQETESRGTIRGIGFTHTADGSVVCSTFAFVHFHVCQFKEIHAVGRSN